MRLFECQTCGNIVYFENTSCVACGSSLGYDPVAGQMLTVADANGNAPAPAPGKVAQLLCANSIHDVCNWLVPVDAGSDFCKACRHNRTVPDLSILGNGERWRRIELAKRHLFYSLMRLGLPIAEPGTGPMALEFEFVATVPDATGKQKPALTGHNSGRITINVAEADDAVRESRRVAMGEPYRTLLGHFRHEIGHYYWDVLVRDTAALANFRALFGDERADYAKALEHHYSAGPPADWQRQAISAYATAHPWEDFAETWAHYLHMVDALEMARSFGIGIRGPLEQEGRTSTEVIFDPYGVRDVGTLLDAWVPLTVAMNSINRSMGQPDFYPFVLSKPIVDKLAFIHGLTHPR